MRNEGEVINAIANDIYFEQVYAQAYHERKQAFMVHQRPWYEFAMQAESRRYFQTLASRYSLQWMMGNEHEPITYAEPPLPTNYAPWPDRHTVPEVLVPWRQLVYDFNHSVERVGYQSLTQQAFYQLCKDDYEFRIRWTPYASLEFIEEANPYEIAELLLP